jgi:hypothetical protein
MVMGAVMAVAVRNVTRSYLVVCACAVVIILTFVFFVAMTHASVTESFLVRGTVMAISNRYTFSTDNKSCPKNNTKQNIV